MRTALHIAIVLALAAAVAFLPGGGGTADLLLWLVGILFWGALAWFLSRLYREYRTDIFGLGDRMRAVLYVSIAVIVVTVTGTRVMWETPGGMLAWFGLVGAASYGLFMVWRHWRELSSY